MIYLFANAKGGVGKSMLALNIAAMAAQAKKNVVLVDADPVNRSSWGWYSARKHRADVPQIECLPVKGEIGRELLELRKKHDIVIVDSAGHDSVEIRQGLAVCDRAIIPIRPVKFDAWGMAYMRKLIAEAEEKSGAQINAMTVLSCVNAQRKAKTIKVRVALDQSEIPRLDTVIHDRTAVLDASDEGLAVVELKPGRNNESSRIEFMSLYKEIFHEAYRV
jgi:chromosome partitioning protein